MKRVLLIHAPVAKPGEPPAGIARLKGSLNQNGISCSVIDANIDGLYFILNQKSQATDKWSVDAYKLKERHLVQLKNKNAFKTIDHYNRIVRDINRLLYNYGEAYEYHLGLADCSHLNLSPSRSDDLIQCAEQPKKNPYYNYYSQILIPQIENEDPSILGLSINFLSQALCAFALIGILKKSFPNIKIIIGGGLVTSWIRNANWQEPFQGLVDACVDGPGEAYFLSSSSLMKYAAPDFSDLDLNQYLSPGFVIPYNTSTGCYWRKCSFCPECAEENEYHPIPHKNVLDDINALSKTSNASLIHFLDNALAPSLLNQFIDHPLPLPWYGYVRFEKFLLDPEFCLHLKKSGCVMLKLGLESGSQSVLEQMQKGIHLEDVIQILRNLKNANISTFIYLLFGTPYESEAEALKTLTFVQNHHEGMGYINPAIFNMPISGKEAAEANIRPFSQGDLSLYTDFEHPKGWDRISIRNFLDRKFKRDPIISSILKRTPKIFTSNHAPYFHL